MRQLISKRYRRVSLSKRAARKPTFQEFYSSVEKEFDKHRDAPLAREALNSGFNGGFDNFIKGIYNGYVNVPGKVDINAMNEYIEKTIYTSFSNALNDDTLIKNAGVVTDFLKKIYSKTFKKELIARKSPDEILKLLDESHKTLQSFGKSVGSKTSAEFISKYKLARMARNKLQELNDVIASINEELPGFGLKPKEVEKLKNDLLSFNSFFSVPAKLGDDAKREVMSLRNMVEGIFNVEDLSMLGINPKLKIEDIQRRFAELSDLERIKSEVIKAIDENTAIIYREGLQTHGSRFLIKVNQTGKGMKDAATATAKVAKYAIIAVLGYYGVVAASEVARFFGGVADWVSGKDGDKKDEADKGRAQTTTELPTLTFDEMLYNANKFTFDQAKVAIKQLKESGHSQEEIDEFLDYTNLTDAQKESIR